MGDLLDVYINEYTYMCAGVGVGVGVYVCISSVGLRLPRVISWMYT